MREFLRQSQVLTTSGRGQFLAGKLAWHREHPGSDRKLLDMPYIMLPSLSHLLLTRISSTVVTRRRPCASAATRYPMSACTAF
jgi:hypothetical protein